MSTDYWDALEENLAERVVAEQVLARTAVVRACRDHPLAPVQHLTLALSSIAAVLEGEWLSGSLSEQTQLLDVYRTMVALSADIALLDLGRLDQKTCSDLLIHWGKTEDAFFVVGGA